MCEKQNKYPYRKETYTLVRDFRCMLILAVTRKGLEFDTCAGLVNKVAVLRLHLESWNQLVAIGEM